MPKVTVVLFALFRDAAGWSTKEYEVSDGTTVGELVKKILEENPGLSKAVKELKDRGYEPLVLVNGRAIDYLEEGDKAKLKDGDRIAILPPAGGG